MRNDIYMEGIQIREAAEEDREIVLEMMKDSVMTESADQEISSSVLEHSFDTAVAGSILLQIYVIECEGHVIGYCAVGFSYSCQAGGKILWLEKLYLKPPFHGENTGRKVLDWLEKTYRSNVLEMRVILRPDLDADERTHIIRYRRMF